MGLLAEELSRDKNNEVIWFTSSFDHFKKVELFDNDTVYRVKDNYHLQILYAKGYKKNISIARIINHRRLGIKLRKQMRKMDKPDIIFVSFPTIEFAEEAIKYGKKNHVPVVTDVRDLWPDNFKQNLSGIIKIMAIPYIWFLDIKTKKIFKNTDYITSISDLMVDWGIKKGRREKTKNDKSFFIGYKKEDRIEKLKNKEINLDKNKFNISFFATINNQFNYELVIRIAKKLEKTKANFIICGLGPQLDYFKELAKDSSNIQFLGWQDKDNLNYVLKSSKIGLAPYKDTFDFQMSVSNKYSEYLSYGLPIVITSSGYMKEITEKYNVGISSGDAGEISEYIIKLMNDDIKYNKVSNNSKELFENKFNANKIYKDLVKHLEKIEKEYRK